MWATHSLRRIISLNHANLCKDINNSTSIIVQLNRFKSKEGKPNKNSESSDSDQSDDVQNLDKSSKTMKISVTSLRIDSILKSGLGIARNKIEKLFYESKIRVNGEKVGKKSEQVEEGDEIDVIKGPSPSNPELLIVARVEVLSMKPDEDSISVKIRRCKTLLVENYEKNWKPS